MTMLSENVEEGLSHCPGRAKKGYGTGTLF